MTCEISYPVEFLREILNYTATDHDGVMANTKLMATKTFNKWFGTNHKPQEINTWDSITKWAVDCGLSKEDGEWIEKEIWYSEDLLFESEPMPGAVEFMTKAYGLGYKIPIYSSRPFEQKGSTLLWYKKYMPFIEPDNIHVGLPDIHKNFTKSWMILKAGEPKKLFIEDTPHHAKEIIEGTDALVILISNSAVLDNYLGQRLLRIAGKNGEMPDLWPLYKAFFGKRQ